MAVMWLRHTDPDTIRPFKVPLYPVIPLIFCAVCAWLTYSSISYAISQKAIHVSLWLIASGILALLILRVRERTLEQLPHQT
jgi:amino acid transporter